MAIQVGQGVVARATRFRILLQEGHAKFRAVAGFGQLTNA